jgi:fructose-1-phosphate kinase PfkB-like protein
MAQPKIINVGFSSFIERVLEVESLRVGTSQRVREVSRWVGGKGLSVARGLSSMGVENAVTGFLGRENRRRFDPLLEDPFLLDAFVELDGRTPENVIIADHETAGETELIEEGLAVGAEEIQLFSDRLSELISPDALVIFSGRTEGQFPREDLARLVGQCRQAGARLVDHCGGEVLRCAPDEPVELIQVNAAELACLADRTLETPEARTEAAAALRGHATGVIFTDGPRGAYLFCEEMGLHAHAEVDPFEVCSTAGCGAVLLGTYLGGLALGQDVRQSFIDAVACAAAATMTFEPGCYETPDLFRMQQAVTAREIENVFEL